MTGPTHYKAGAPMPLLLRLDRRTPSRHPCGSFSDATAEDATMAREANQTNLSKMNIAEVTVQTLAANGIDKVYCLPGVQNDDFFDALVRTAPGIAPIHTRHEQATAYMALGAALATGKPQAYAVVPGPGFLNTTTALATAQSLGAPVVAISGQIPEWAIGKGIGFLHEIPRQLEIMRALTKWAAHLESPEDAMAKTHEALRQCISGAPGPVGLEAGWNMWRRGAEIAFDPQVVARETPAIDTDRITAAAAMLAASAKPVIVVGGGAQDASAEVRELSRRLQAPVIANRTGHGVLDGRDAFAMPNLGGHMLWADVDCVLGIGTRLQQPMDWGRDDNLKVVHIDADATRIGRIGPADISIVGDAAEAARLLLEALQRVGASRGDRTAEMQDLKKRMVQRLEALAPQKAWIDAIRAELPEDGILVEELTQISYASRMLYPVYGPRTYLSTGYQGTLGWGYATALGAKAAMPGRAVVSLSGDGGFMFGMQELATAVRHGLGVVAVVFNDGAYGNVRRIQQQNYEGRLVATDLANPDFVKLGESFGIRSERVETPADLRKAMRSALGSDAPALIEVPVGTFPDPWPHIMLPKVRGEKR